MKKMCIDELEKLAKEIIPLAEKAGDVIRELYQTDVKIIRKPDGTPVTSADQASHDLIEQALLRLNPDIPVISEEGTTTPQGHRYWLVDPLDGTQGFISHSGNFCVNIALIDDNHPVLGCIHIPLKKETYVGYGKQDGFWQDGRGVCHPLRLTGTPPDGYRVLVGHVSKKAEDPQNLFLEKVNVHSIRSVGSAIKFCLLAKGEADLYLRLKESYEWDTAAGQAIVEACGGCILNLDKTPLTYGKPNLLNSGFVAVCDDRLPW